MNLLATEKVDYKKNIEKIQKIGKIFKQKKNRVKEGKEIMSLLPYPLTDLAKSSGNNVVFKDEPTYKLNKDDLIKLIGAPSKESENQLIHYLGYENGWNYSFNIQFKRGLVYLTILNGST